MASYKNRYCPIACSLTPVMSGLVSVSCRFFCFVGGGRACTRPFQRDQPSTPLSLYPHPPPTRNLGSDPHRCDPPRLVGVAASGRSSSRSARSSMSRSSACPNPHPVVDPDAHPALVRFSSGSRQSTYVLLHANHAASDPPPSCAHASFSLLSECRHSMLAPDRAPRSRLVNDETFVALRTHARFWSIMRIKAYSLSTPRRRLAPFTAHWAPSFTSRPIRLLALATVPVHRVMMPSSCLANRLRARYPGRRLRASRSIGPNSLTRVECSRLGRSRTTWRNLNLRRPLLSAPRERSSSPPAALAAPAPLAQVLRIIAEVVEQPRSRNARSNPCQQA